MVINSNCYNYGHGYDDDYSYGYGYGYMDMYRGSIRAMIWR